MLLREELSALYLIAFAVMSLGSVLVVRDTLIRHHAHLHEHSITHTHDGTTHTHVIAHSHEHEHFVSGSRHGHHHSREELLRELRATHR